MRFPWNRSRAEPKPEPEIPSGDREAISSAVYFKLDKILPRYSSVDATIGSPLSKERVEQADKKAAEIEEWALSLPGGPVRDAYLSWLRDFYRHGYAEALKEIETGKERRRYEEFWRDVRETSNRARAMSDSIPNPPSQQQRAT